MRIGILTFQWASNQNYGAILQAFAGQTLIKKINDKYEVKVIDYIPEEIKNSKKNKITFLTGKGFIDFRKKFLNLTRECNTEKDLIKLNEEIDTFIVGSDQVWRGKWIENIRKHYFFDFVENNKKKIAYAASFGVDFWEGNYELTEEIKPLIKRFDNISVREESGIDICRDIFNIEDSVCVLDPTLMISKKEYQPILDEWKDRKHLMKKYVVYMLLDENKLLKKESRKIANYLKSEIKYIKGKTFKILGKEITFYNKVSQWLTYLKDSQLVITDSFHCTVFSIIFQKKFIVITNEERGVTRLENLLIKFGLEDRMFKNIEEVIKSGILDKEIDYKKVDKKLKVYKEFSIEFLKKTLRNETNV